MGAALVLRMNGEMGKRRFQEFFAASTSTVLRAHLP